MYVSLTSSDRKSCKPTSEKEYWEVSLLFKHVGPIPSTSQPTVNAASGIKELKAINSETRINVSHTGTHIIGTRTIKTMAEEIPKDFLA